MQLSRTLSYLYYARAGIALIWLSALAAADGQPGSAPRPLAWTLLVIYPAIDAGAVLVDIIKTPRRTQTRFQNINLAASLAATVAVAATAIANDAPATLIVYGIWAIASGAVQLIVGARRTALISAQWFMIISGAGSTFAGTTFLGWSGTSRDAARTLIQYAGGGTLWYAVAATWLLASTWDRSRIWIDRRGAE